MYSARLSCALVVALVLPAAAAAQEASTPTSVPEVQSKRRFTLADFSQYSPVTALDMVRRIPGFSIAQNDGRRGFGDNSGNVLIDGDRPSTKTDSISDILSRIPASRVAYVELIEEAGADGELRGKGQIVNVVRKAGGSFSGTYDAAIVGNKGYGVIPYGSVAVELKRGTTDFELSAGHFVEPMLEKGPDNYLNGSGALVEYRNARTRPVFQNYTFRSGLKTRAFGAKVNLGAKLDLEDFKSRRDSLIYSATNVLRGTDLLTSHGPNWSPTVEGSADVEFPLAKSLTTKLVSLYRWGKSTDIGSVETRFPGSVSSSSFEQRSRPQEGIFRVQNDWALSKSNAVQFGTELAYNSLGSVFSGLASTNGVAAPFPTAKVKVWEWRLEPFVSDVWSISPSWKLEGGLVFENSRLRLTGDDTASRNLSFLKPRLVATWTASKTTSLEFRAERQVSQLDFNEFATAVDLGAGSQVDAGNAELVPERGTRLTALVRHKFLGRGSIQLEGSYERISDTLDLIPIFFRNAAGAIIGVGDGTGNIGKSKRWNAELEINLPFDWLTNALGIKGMELRYVGHYHGSEVIDPVTKLTRRVSGRPLWHQNWNFRHDLNKLGIAWGFSAATAHPSKRYFASQLRTDRVATEYGLFIEYRKFKFGTLKFEVDNPIRVRLNRTYEYFANTRANSGVVSILDRNRTRSPRLTFSLSGKF